MKVYSWKTLLVTIFVGFGFAIWSLLQLIRGEWAHLFWLPMSLWLIFQGFRASLTQKGYEEDQQRGEIGRRVYRKLFGRFALIMPYSGVLLFLMAAMTYVFHPPIWLYILFVALALAYMAWLSWIVRRHIELEEEQFRRRAEDIKEQDHEI